MSTQMKDFFGTIIICIIAFFLLGNYFDAGNYIETAVYTFGTIIIGLLSYIISFLRQLRREMMGEDDSFSEE
ncbi:hypothetical protein MUN88_12355 [Gracilibacillus caseinilyticus]|uniref:YrhC-like protein n=1 Tax=Gracilibacillus caseinilyticus TaxID=2932256 RepID=A0ABY4ER32_9BACI|nr:hypothetical protein [Gracilibacillus caseinilyticus]UOQ46884.1 hypothetical protein MUN88_12355 [Gracilibacillus caseinilyticus]